MTEEPDKVSPAVGERPPHGGLLNRAGRKLGSRNAVSRKALARANDPELIDAAFDALRNAVLAGDVKAAEIVLCTALPKPRPAPAPVPGGLDVQDAAGLLEAFRKLVLALGNGTLAPSEVSQASAALKGLAEAMSLSDFEGRLTALEDAAQAKAKGGQNE
ncbi:hypothetical protein [Rhodobacteraceae bacterium DSL-40]|uniref:hypothetical protein n=1 Tax=Amaricoccus sp. B4 TaxID=3368557 RepID=UPI000DAB4353